MTKLSPVVALLTVAGGAGLVNAACNTIIPGYEKEGLTYKFDPETNAPCPSIERRKVQGPSIQTVDGAIVMRADAIRFEDSVGDLVIDAKTFQDASESMNVATSKMASDLAAATTTMDIAIDGVRDTVKTVEERLQEQVDKNGREATVITGQVADISKRVDDLDGPGGVIEKKVEPLTTRVKALEEKATVMSVFDAKSFSGDTYTMSINGGQVTVTGIGFTKTMKATMIFDGKTYAVKVDDVSSHTRALLTIPKMTMKKDVGLCSTSASQADIDKDYFGSLSIVVAEGGLPTTVDIKILPRMIPTQEYPYGNGEDGKLSVTSSFNWRSKAAKTYEMKDKSLKSLGGDKYRVEATNANGDLTGWKCGTRFIIVVLASKLNKGRNAAPIDGLGRTIVGTVIKVSGKSIDFESPTLTSLSGRVSKSEDSSALIVLQKVPQYTTVEITGSGEIVTDNFNDANGNLASGIIAFAVKDKLTMARMGERKSAINADMRGFPGGKSRGHGTQTFARDAADTRLDEGGGDGERGTQHGHNRRGGHAGGGCGLGNGGHGGNSGGGHGNGGRPGGGGGGGADYSWNGSGGGGAYCSGKSYSGFEGSDPKMGRFFWMENDRFRGTPGGGAANGAGGGASCAYQDGGGKADGRGGSQGRNGNGRRGGIGSHGEAGGGVVIVSARQIETSGFHSTAMIASARGGSGGSGGGGGSGCHKNGGGGGGQGAQGAAGGAVLIHYEEGPKEGDLMKKLTAAGGPGGGGGGGAGVANQHNPSASGGGGGGAGNGGGGGAGTTDASNGCRGGNGETYAWWKPTPGGGERVSCHGRGGYAPGGGGGNHGSGGRAGSANKGGRSSGYNNCGSTCYGKDASGLSGGNGGDANTCCGHDGNQAAGGGGGGAGGDGEAGVTLVVKA